MLYVEDDVMLTLWTYYSMNRMNECNLQRFAVLYTKIPYLWYIEKKIHACMQIP